MSDSFKSSYEAELNGRGRLVFTNVGTSMLPLLRQKRDLMVIDKKTNERCKKYDAVLYKRSNGQYVLHRILKVRQNDYVICGDNCFRKEYGITDDNILGILTAVVRNGRTISVNDFKYLLYVHIWCDLFPLRASILAAKHILRRILIRIRKGKCD